MKVTLLRDSIVGVGQIERPVSAVGMGDAVQCGMVVKPKMAKTGDIVNLPDGEAQRMISLGSARKPLAEDSQPQKKAA